MTVVMISVQIIYLTLEPCILENQCIGETLQAQPGEPVSSCVAKVPPAMGSRH